MEDKSLARRPSAKSFEAKSFADSAAKKGADPKDPSEAGPSKKKQSEMTKAERSAIQEAQRAAKASKKAGDDGASLAVIGTQFRRSPACDR